MRYQFQIDGKPAGPLRTTWREAAWDAVSLGYATWGDGANRDAIFLDDSQGATIEKLLNF